MATKTVGQTTLTYSVNSSGPTSTVVTVSLVAKDVFELVVVPAKSTRTVRLTASGKVGSLSGTGTKEVTVSNTGSWSAVKSAKANIDIISSKTITYAKGTSAQIKTLSFSCTETGDSGSVSISVPALTSYTVSYNANGGSGAPSAQTKYYGKTLTLSSAKPTKTGHTFSKWNTNAGGTGTSYNSGASYTANSGATLYAQYTANKYTISYNANGGSGTVASQTKTYNTALTLQNGNALSRKGTLNGAVTEYILKGWNTTADGTGTHYDGGASAPNITANLVLYAEWELKYIYPTISNVEIIRNDTADPLDVTETDDGTYIRLSFDWTGCSKDAGATTETPDCVITIGEDEYTPTLTNDFTFKPDVEYSADEAFRITITLTDPDRASSTVVYSGIIATAIYPIDLQAYDNNEVSMGVMHTAVEGQTLTLPSRVYLQTDLDKHSVTALQIQNKETDTSMWVGISLDGIAHGLFSNLVGRWMIQQADADTLNIAGERMSIDKDGYVTFKFKGNANGYVAITNDRELTDTMFRTVRTDTNVSAKFGIGNGGTNHGIYSDKLGKWLIYGDTNDVYVNGVKQKNINAVQASKVGNYWTSGNLAFMRRGNVVHFTGSPTVRAVSGRQTIAQINNVDLRPYGQVYVPFNGSTEFLLINQDGTIQMNTTSAGTKYMAIDYMAAT